MSEVTELTNQLKYDIRELKKLETKINTQITKDQELKATVTEIFNYVKLSHAVNVSLSKLNTLRVEEEMESKIISPETLENVSTMVLPRILERLDEFMS